MVGAAVLLAAGLTVLLAAGHEPALGGHASAPIAAFLRLAPLAMLSCFATAALDTALVTFLPLYADGIGVEAARALYLLTIMGLGGILLVYPFGWLADRVNRRVLTLAIVVLLIAATASIPLMMQIPPADLLFFFVVGGLLGALYTMANVHMGERFRGADLAAASTMFAVMWGIGALLAPPIGGLGLDLSPRYGLPLALLAMVALAFPVALRSVLRKPRATAPARPVTPP
jgi:MFS family permease